MAKIDFAWELGGHTGHVTTLLPIARALKARGHEVRFLLKDERAGSDLAGIDEIPREGAPNWQGPVVYTDPLNFGEILHNFGYQDPGALKQLVDAWRERLWLSHAVVANVAPSAHVAARTLGIPSFEISQSFHIPPRAMPAPPLRDWEAASRERLQAADQRVIGAINTVLAAFGVDPIATIGDIFAGRSMLLTYPELDIYPERGPAEYYGVPRSGEGSLVPEWPPGRGPRLFGYLYNYYRGVPMLLDAAVSLDAPTLLFCRAAPPEIRARDGVGPLRILEEPMAVSKVMPQCDVVVCHGSHQTTAQALLAGKPVLALPTQLEQFLITRRVVRYGAGLGVAPDVANADFLAALRELSSNPRYRARATEFATRYAAQDPAAALASMIGRCEQAAVDQAAKTSGQPSVAKGAA